MSYNKVGDVLVEQGNLPEGLKSFTEVLAIADRLAKAEPGNAGWQRDLSVSYEKVGNGLMAQGHLPEALASFRDGLAIRDRLAKAEPGNAEWQSDLSLSYNKVGTVLVAQGDLPEALKSYQASLTISERLAQADSGNAVWRRDLSMSYRAVGRTYFDLANFSAAAASLERAVEIDPSYAFGVMWLYLSRARSGDQSALARLQADAAKLDRTEWTFRLVELLLGSDTPEALLSAAPNPDARCEAQFYVGEWQLLRGAATQARDAFRSAADTCPKSFIEYAGSVAELKRLEQ